MSNPNVVQKNLSPKAEAFCVALVNNDGRAELAAKEAGYTDSSAHVMAYRLPRDSRVQERIHHLTRQRIGIAALQAAAKIEKLACEARSERVQLDAARDILDRAGFKTSVDAMNIVGIEVNIDLG